MYPCTLLVGHTSQSGRHGQGQGQGQGRDSMRDIGSLKRYGSWFGYGPQRNGQSLAVAQEYQVSYIMSCHVMSCNVMLYYVI
jgi:hypothetical protein